MGGTEVPSVKSCQKLPQCQVGPRQTFHWPSPSPSVMVAGPLRLSELQRRRKIWTAAIATREAATQEKNSPSDTQVSAEEEGRNAPAAE